MHEKYMSRTQIIGLLHKLPNDIKIPVYSDSRWNYPEQGDTQKTCTMLDMNFNIEKKPGIVIHIPDKIFEDLHEPLPRRKLGKDTVTEG